MPAITLTPGSSTSNVIRLTYNAGALNGNVGSFDPYIYIVQDQVGTYYWANSVGTPQPGPIEAADPFSYPITSALKSGIRRNVLGLVTADFIQAGNNYVVNDTVNNTYIWCNIAAVIETPPVDAVSYYNETAYRYGIIWTVLTLYTTGGETGTGTGTGTDTGPPE
jgi:hypothetical protein